VAGLFEQFGGGGHSPHAAAPPMPRVAVGEPTQPTQTAGQGGGALDPLAMLAQQSAAFGARARPGGPQPSGGQGGQLGRTRGSRILQHGVHSASDMWADGPGAGAGAGAGAALEQDPLAALAQQTAAFGEGRPRGGAREQDEGLSRWF
jgi:hypothetical protein